MFARRPVLLPLSLLALSPLALSACGAGEAPAPAATAAVPPAAGRVAVTASDDACGLDRDALPAGRNVLAITNTGSSPTEVYLYGAGDRVVSEKEGIAPGTSYDLTVEVPAGDYVVACKPGQTGAGIRTPLVVTGDAAPVDPAGVEAVAAYRAYVQAQADALVPLVQAFTAAVAAGDVATAKALYAPSREPWERIEPVAESFGDLDPKIDLREADLEPGQAWTGWHRIEKALWVGGSTAGLGPVAEQLVVDVTELQRRVPTAELSVASIGNGAKELLDEVASSKVTGEEEAFSHTDLLDVEANVAGAAQALQVLRPLVDDAALLTRLDTAFAALDTELSQYAVRDGADPYVSYDTVDAAGRRELARVVDALGEPLSQLSAAASR